MNAEPTSEQFDLKVQFEMTMNTFVNTHPDSHLEGIMATILSYRDFIKQNVEKASPLKGTRFVSWMKSADRDPESYPEPWGAELVQLFDEIVIEAAQDHNMQPTTIVSQLDEWAEQTKTDVKRVHGLREGFFDV